MALQHRLGLLSSRRARPAFNHHLNSCLTRAHLAARAGSVLASRHDRHVLDDNFTANLFDFQFRVPSDEDPEPFARILSTPILVKLAAMLPPVAPQEHAAILPVSRRPDNRLFFFKALATKHDKTQVADAAEAVTELDHKYSKFMKELTFDAKDRWSLELIRVPEPKSLFQPEIWLRIN
jgi:hypothetical protein